MIKTLKIGAGLLLLSVSAFSQAAYITDKLVAGLYQEAKVSDKPIKALNSGTPLEVVSRENGFVKVRTSDGTVGYVEATYLTDEKPARSILLDTQAKLSVLQKQLELVKNKADSLSDDEDASDVNEWQEKLTKAQGQISQLEIQLKAAKLNNQKQDQSRQALEQENQALRDQMAQVAKILNVPFTAKADSSTVEIESKSSHAAEVFANDWLWILFVIGLAAGFAGGFFYMRHKVSKRFGTVMRF